MDSKKKQMMITIIVMFSLLARDFASAQDITPFPEMQGTWVLDSVQVKEVTPDSIVQKTVLPDEHRNFNGSWMQRFTLDTDGKASYAEIAGFTVTDVPYAIKDKDGNAATLIIDGVPEYKILSVQLLSSDVMRISISFITGYNLKDIEVDWKMFYRKLATEDLTSK